MRLEALTAEWRLLLACAAHGPDPGAVRGLLGADLDWQALIDRAVRHGLAPLLRATLRATSLASPPGPPDAILARLQELYERHASRHAGRIAKLAEIGAGLDAAGIPFIVLKGAALGSVVYRDPAFRTMGDVDLLARRENLAAASRVLRRLGYSSDESWRTEAWYATHHHHLAPLVAPDGSLIVELHSSIVGPGGARVPVDGLWERAGLERIGDARFRVLAPSDLLLHLCLHLAHDNVFIDGKLRDLRDMAETIRHYGDAIGWDAVVGQAKTWQVSRYVYWSLWLARDQVGAAVPPVVLERLADAHRARRSDALPAPPAAGPHAPSRTLAVQAAPLADGGDGPAAHPPRPSGAFRRPARTPRRPGGTGRAGARATDPAGRAPRASRSLEVCQRGTSPLAGGRSRGSGYPMTAAAEVRARLEARVSRPEAVPPLSVVGLLTRDRVERVRRALASFRENARRHGRRPSFVVADNSEALSTQAACREALAALRAADPEPPEIRYVGLREREAFVDRLARLGIDPEVARFGLLDVTGCGFAAGANRNALLLATAGERFLSVDDDVVCALAPSPAPAPGIELFSGSGDGYENYNPADFWFFDDRAALERAVHPEDTDALGLHEAVLGRDLGACLSAAAGEPVKLDRFAPRLLERVIARGGQARVTLPGLFGDIGWYAPTWLLLLTGASRERFTGSEAKYESACASRRVLRVVPRPTITDGRFFQSTLLGLDNRVPLPPFMPVQRYEDGVFRIALRACFEDAYFAHLPWAALHDSDEGRRWAREDIWQTAAWIRTGELLVHCVHSYAPSPGADPEERLRALGAHLVSVGELPAADFRAFVRARVVAQKSRYLEHLEALLREHGDAPAYWARDLRRHAATVRDALGTDAFFVPRDLVVSRQAAGPESRHHGGPGERTLDQAQAIAQQLVRGYGALLHLWPDLVGATRELRARGVELGAAVGEG